VRTEKSASGGARSLDRIGAGADDLGARIDAVYAPGS